VWRLTIIGGCARNRRRFLLTLSDNGDVPMLTLFASLLAIIAPCLQSERRAHVPATGAQPRRSTFSKSFVYGNGLGESWPKTEWLVSAQDIRKLPFNRARAPILKLKSAGLGALVAQVFVSTDNGLQP